jgi:hypothetical protein
MSSSAGKDLAAATAAPLDDRAARDLAAHLLAAGRS